MEHLTRRLINKKENEHSHFVFYNYQQVIQQQLKENFISSRFTCILYQSYVFVACGKKSLKRNVVWQDNSIETGKGSGDTPISIWSS